MPSTPTATLFRQVIPAANTDSDVAAAGLLQGPGEAFTMSSRQGVGLSIDLSAMLASGHLQHINMSAGDVLIFPSAASVHGTIPWRGAEPRRSVLFGYYAMHNPRRPRL